MKTKKYASLNIKVKDVNADLFQIRAVFSTPMQDRHGEIVDQKGWDLQYFLLNPVVLWAHDQMSPAIGKVIDIAIVDGNLEGTIQFAAAEYEFAKTIYNLMAGGYISAISVGFANNKWQYDETNDQLILLQNELYEVSVVNVPANALALAKSKGVDISVIEKKITISNAIHEKFIKKDDDGVTGKPEDEEESKETPAPEVDEQTAKPKEEPAPAGEPAPEAKPEPVDAVKALEVLIKSDNGVISAAVKELQSRLDAAKTSQSRSTDGGKTKYSVTQLNRVIRKLHQSKIK